MDVFEFQRQFDQQRSEIELPADCSGDEPEILSTSPPLTWTVEWILHFSDHTHVRIWEYYDKFAGLAYSRRVSFALHYGPDPVKNAAGEIDPSQPVFIRIDTCGGEPHLHLAKREPHIPQSKVSGRVLDEITSMEFIKAVLRSRKTGKSIDSLLRLRVAK